MDALLHLNPPQPSWWEANGDSLLAGVMIVCSIGATGVVALTAFWLS